MAFSFGAPPSSTGNAPAPSNTGGGFTFAPAPAAAAPAGGGFSFGNATSKTSTTDANNNKAPAPSGGLFGGGNAPAPAAGGFSFGAPPAATTNNDANKTSSTATSAPATGFSFGATSSKDTNSKAPSPAAGGFNFGAPSSATSDKDKAKDDTTTTPAAKSGGGLFGTTPGTTPAAKAPSPVLTPATNATGGGLFGGTPATSTKTTTPSAATGTTTTSTTNNTSSTTPAASTTPAPANNTQPKMIEPPPIEYQSLTIEQILNRFQSELETDTIAFLTEAQRIAHYDATLRDTQHSLSELTNMVSRLMLHQSEVDTQLSGIGSYQNELSTTLDVLERNVDELFASQSNVNVQDSDIEREKSYERAIIIDKKLDGMVSTLNHVVNDLNAAQERVWSASSSGGGEGKNDEEVGKIIGVFNAHHDTLAYLEGKARSVESDLRMIDQVLAKSGQ